VVNISPIMTGKHDPTMGGKVRPAIDSCWFNRYLSLFYVLPIMDSFGFTMNDSISIIKDLIKKRNWFFVFIDNNIFQA